MYDRYTRRTASLGSAKALDLLVAAYLALRHAGQAAATTEKLANERSMS